MGADSLNADELVVKAELIGKFAEEDFSMSGLHDRLMDIMDLEGYFPEDRRKALLNTRTIRYYLKHREKEKGTIERVLGVLSSNQNEPDYMDYHDQLGTTRDDIPFEIEFRFLPLTKGEMIELRTEMTIVPAVVLHHEMVRRRDDYNAQNAVRSCKEFARTIAAEFGWMFHTEPYTPASSLRPTADDQTKLVLTDMEYGRKVIEFSDEGDEALKYGLDHSALASYIHAIEWTIIAHLKAVADFDVFEKEEGGPGFSYKLLVDLLEEHGNAHQTTIENLKKHRTDRRIMAHHKSGKLSSSHVHSVKESLKHLMEDTIRGSN